ncbi:inorganic phosphate transporter [Flavobacterium johnsoniae]|uniref:Phosphate transporter n=1 Tax=Flavobacterium johnsoniae (strain ATCC 17061 / DSM 2064 / JCM 8514 / BCRC 14874 / CCUG 350202 / NBRC 14942 / NCIMB 11054 / UW101) TaxID=376686 RepID=A5FGR2_FLAJ1|nr:inorganic phosphate transporter [Flavobacterium johnsoniae]ABQ05605.1 phosphate transporter [Flavobacterium johnsoniae UW101]OXG00122.1 inorganic phosphate transporter [Flavobacterium johnsoniae UW101]WQG82592.1 inorganic phosphate transporter [Flavobacterium johnsoniae UW101]SHL52567.1 inorganic phosphate transporter, PiT family [Flavobacterium johnsoniae]
MTLLILIIVLALIFDYINGFHDAANAIATVVATKVLTPFQAVVWAAFFNFLAYWVFGFGVADTVAKTAHTMEINLVVILAGVIAAICWNLLTWWLGIPSSSSHTLIGGFAGAAVAHAIAVHGFSGYVGEDGATHYWYEIVSWYKAGKDGAMPSGVLIIIAFIVLAPLLGALASYLISIWLLNASRKSIGPKIFTGALMIATIVFVYYQMIPYSEIDKPRFDSHFWSVAFEAHNIKWFLVAFIVLTVSGFCMIFSSLNLHQADAALKKMQLLSSAAFSLGHGGNDSQKVMGIIAAAVAVYINTNHGVHMDAWLDVVLPNEDLGIKGQMPSWIPLACYSAIAAGTLSGGWKIVKTMGSKITKVSSFEGVAAETAGALTLYFTEHLKIPVSTTHTITGSIIGVGLTKRVSAVRWGVTVSLVWAWILTIPISAILAGLVYFILSVFIS